MEKIELKIAGIWVILILILLTQILFYTWCRIQCVGVGYEISEQIDEHRDLVTRQGNLKIELARLKSPERIAEIARQIGLTTPKQDQMIIISRTD